MDEKHFMFADFVQEFEVPFIAHDPSDGHYNDSGTWVKGGTLPTDRTGIILPLSNNDMRNEPNGMYTSLDRKIYVTDQLTIGQRIEYKGQFFTVNASKPYEDYADVYIYFAKGVIK